MNLLMNQGAFKTSWRNGADGAGEITSLLRGLLSSQDPHSRDAAPAQQAAKAIEFAQSVIELVRSAGDRNSSPLPEAPPSPSLPLAATFAGQSGLSPESVPAGVRDLLARLGAGASGLSGGITPPWSQAASQPLPAGASFVEHVYADASGTRAYKLYVPSGYDGAPIPLVVMLHGCTQSPDDFAAGTEMNLLAEEQKILVAYPAQPQSANASKCWNWFNSGDQQRGSGEPALIAGITRQIIKDHKVDPSRVYIAGLSAGGAAAAIMGTAYPDLYAAVGVHSGLACGAASDMPSAFAAMRQGGAFRDAGGRASSRPVPTIVFHGDQDKTVNPVNGDQVVAQFKAAAGPLGSEVTRGSAPDGLSYTRTVQAGSDGQPCLEQWLVHGAAHAWSGGSRNGSYTEPRGPDASREMLRFFLAHSNDAPASSERVEA